jgi:hypothetical protein
MDEVIRTDGVRLLTNDSRRVVEPELVVDNPVELLQTLLTLPVLPVTGRSLLLSLLNNILLANPEGLTLMLNLVELPEKTAK